METLRTFIAIEMPPCVADLAGRAQAAMKRDGIHLRWVRPGNIHLTLRFLGDIGEETLPSIRKALADSAERQEPFSLKVKGVGVFPGMAHPNVMWMGMAGQVEMLNGLYRTLSAFLAECGIPVEKRPFKGHLTIGRVKDPLDPVRLQSALSSISSMETDPFMADAVCLFKSDLTPRGPVYTRLASAPLGNK